MVLEGVSVQTISNVIHISEEVEHVLVKIESHGLLLNLGGVKHICMLEVEFRSLNWVFHHLCWNPLHSLSHRIYTYYLK